MLLVKILYCSVNLQTYIHAGFQETVVEKVQLRLSPHSLPKPCVHTLFWNELTLPGNFFLCSPVKELFATFMK